jgi:hypothetical protein
VNACAKARHRWGILTRSAHASSPPRTPSDLLTVLHILAAARRDRVPARLVRAERAETLPPGLAPPSYESDPR